MTFKEFLLAEGKFRGAPTRGSELRASGSEDDDPKIRAKRNRTNLPDERVKYHRNGNTKSWKSYRKTQHK